MTSLGTTLFLTGLLMLPAMSAAQSLDFTNAKTATDMWTVNDGVMGGVSESRCRHDAEGVLFEGIVSLDNNGGFASVRSAAAFTVGTAVLELKLKGDGKRYKFILRTEASARSPMYQADFIAKEGWHTYRFAPKDFKASFRGRAVQAPVLVFADARELGLLIADKQAGSFSVQWQYVRALSAIKGDE